MTFTLDKYMPYTIGFDSFFNTLDSITGTDVKGYPHYNIKKLDDNKWSIELALAGFSKDDIEIEVKDNVMTINGELKEENNQYVYKGISSRKFSKSFTLAEFTECESAKMENGILSIILEKNIPEDKKPQKVKIK
jgi:molecular chaperone IbpA